MPWNRCRETATRKTASNTRFSALSPGRNPISFGRKEFFAREPHGWPAAEHLPRSAHSLARLSMRVKHFFEKLDVKRVFLQGGGVFGVLRSDSSTSICLMISDKNRERVKWDDLEETGNSFYVPDKHWGNPTLSKLIPITFPFRRSDRFFSQNRKTYITKNREPWSSITLLTYFSQ